MAIFAALSYDIIAATNSSPQTTELNAKARSKTLMKWVNIGLAQSIGFAVLGVLIEAHRGNPVWPPIVGTGLGSGLMWAQYLHARDAGVRSPEPGTETYEHGEHHHGKHAAGGRVRVR